MAIVFQILIGLALLTGLVTIFLTTKIWHWTQVTLVSFIMLFGILALFLSAEVYRIHNILRAPIPRLEQNLARAEQETERFLKGTDDNPGIQELEHQLRQVTRQRGRVWRNVEPTGATSPAGEVTVTIGTPQPHGLSEDSIVYLFESGDPAQGAEYLGDFRVTATAEAGVTLEPIELLAVGQQVIDPRTLDKLANSDGPWSFYDTMPADRHNLYDDLAEEQIRELFRGLLHEELEEEVIEQFVRHGQEATDDDDPLDVIHLDENGNRVDPDTAEKVVKKVYERPLRDYAYLFGELARQKVVLIAELQAVAEDNAKIKVALDSARKLTKFRQQEIKDLKVDLDAVQTEQQVAEAHRDQVLRGLQTAKARIDTLLAENSSLASRFRDAQLQLVNLINQRAPAP